MRVACESVSHSVVLTVCDPMDHSPPGSSVHDWILQARILEWVLLQGIFLTQELNLGPLHCWWILYHLSHRESPTRVGVCGTQTAHYLTLAWDLIKLLDSCGYCNLNLPGNGRWAFLEVQRLLLSWKMRLRGREHCHIGTIFTSQFLVRGDQVSLWEMLPVSYVSLSLKKVPEEEKWLPPSEEPPTKWNLCLLRCPSILIFSLIPLSKRKKLIG